MGITGTRNQKRITMKKRKKKKKKRKNKNDKVFFIYTRDNYSWKRILLCQRQDSDTHSYVLDNQKSKYKTPLKKKIQRNSNSTTIKS